RCSPRPPATPRATRAAGCGCPRPWPRWCCCPTASPWRWRRGRSPPTRAPPRSSCWHRRPTSNRCARPCRSGGCREPPPLPAFVAADPGDRGLLAAAGVGGQRGAVHPGAGAGPGDPAVRHPHRPRVRAHRQPAPPAAAPGRAAVGHPPVQRARGAPGAGPRGPHPLGLHLVSARDRQHPRHHGAGLLHHPYPGHGDRGAVRRPPLPAGARARHRGHRAAGGGHQAPLRAPADGDLPVNAPAIAGIEVFGHSLVGLAIGMSMYVVGAAMLLALWRLLRGPTVPDRILALDTLNVTAIAELMLLGMHLKTAIYFEAALVIAMLGFVSTVVLCKYVIRRDIVE